MNLKALITGLVVLGSTSAALARPATVSATAHASWSYGAHGSAAGAVVVRDHRHRDGRYDRYDRAPLPAPGYDVTRGRPPFVPVWTTLGSMNQIFDGDMTFAVDPRAARFTTLKLQRTAGKSLIHRVHVEFAGGRTQTIELNKYLLAATPTITIDLAGESARAITKVTVVGRNARQSAYRVLAI